MNISMPMTDEKQFYPAKKQDGHCYADGYRLPIKVKTHKIEAEKWSKFAEGHAEDHLTGEIKICYAFCKVNSLRSP